MEASRAIPPLFLAHGSPMLALEGGAWGRQLRALGAALPPLRGVVVCSAHWETAAGFRVTASTRPPILHDFGGFPEPLYALDYPATGDPALAERVAGLLAATGAEVALDPDRGLDHGTWVPLRYLLPEARVPVVQVSLPRSRAPRRLWAAGQALASLREQSILILGSGGLVHNLSRLDWTEASGPQPWALAFEGWLMDRLSEGDLAGAMDWTRAPGAALAVPSTEHLDPLWLALGAAAGAPLRSIFEGWQLGSLSLRSLAFG